MRLLSVARGVSYLVHFKVLQLLVAVIVVFNIYIAATNVFDKHISNHASKQLAVKLTQLDVSTILTTGTLNLNFKNNEQFQVNNGFKLPTFKTIPTHNKYKLPNKPKYLVPNVPYDELSFKDKILFKLNEVDFNKDKDWLKSQELTSHKVEVHVNEFTQEMWDNNPGLFLIQDLHYLSIWSKLNDKCVKMQQLDQVMKLCCRFHGQIGLI